MMEKFWREEDAVETVEVVLILAALVGVALIFRNAIFEFIRTAVDSIFGDAKDGISTTEPSKTGN